jgi:hypothetical protein
MARAIRDPGRRGSGTNMRWLELFDDHRVFLVRAESDIRAEIEHGALKSVELLRPRRTERLPRFQQGDILLLYRPSSSVPDSPPAELAHVVSVRLELSNDTGYGLGPLFRLAPPLLRERLLFACQRGSLPDVFERVEDRTFTLVRLTLDQRDQFLGYVLNAGIALQAEEGRGGPPLVAPLDDAPGVVEFEW